MLIHKFVLTIFLLMIVGCQTINNALVDQITLPNGKQGLSIDCSDFGWPGCFKAAGDVCKNGYNIHERTTDENTKTEIPIEKMDSKDMIMSVPNPVIPHSRKDKYMVISCK